MRKRSWLYCTWPHPVTSGSLREFKYKAVHAGYPRQSQSPVKSVSMYSNRQFLWLKIIFILGDSAWPSSYQTPRNLNPVYYLVSKPLIFRTSWPWLIELVLQFSRQSSSSSSSSKTVLAHRSSFPFWSRSGKTCTLNASTHISKWIEVGSWCYSPLPSCPSHEKSSEQLCFVMLWRTLDTSAVQWTVAAELLWLQHAHK